MKSSIELRRRSESGLLEEGAAGMGIGTEQEMGKPPCVLIADDEDVARRLLRRALGSWPARILKAPDGMEALRLLLLRGFSIAPL